VVVDVYLISQDGVKVHSAGELSALLDKPDALIWVDIGLCTGQEVGVLSDVFGFHQIAVRDCVERNHVS
jgi:Mg2+ and Co2+ transporter CorA